MGVIVRKSGDLDVQTQSVSVFVQLTNNKKSSLYKGQYLKAYFNTLIVNEVMEIPRNAVFNTNEVFLVKDNLLIKKKVNVVKVNETSMFINGLEENKMVVVEPLINASENTKVKIIEK